jgi:ATP phosphoribosyltransferase
MTTKNANQLVVALNKGRPLTALLEVLSEVGIVPSESPATSRKLVFPTSRSDVSLVVLRGGDVATYVEHGIADVGLLGKDSLLEFPGQDYYELLDLGLARCRLMVAGLVDEGPLPRRIRVATKFVETAKRYYASLGVQADIIKLSGAMELAPVMGLSDRIIDIVETGNTLVANGLESKDLVEDISARLIVNKSSYKTKYRVISDLVKAIESSVAHGEGASA